MVCPRDFLSVLTAESVQLDSMRDYPGEKSDENTLLYLNGSSNAETSEIAGHFSVYKTQKSEKTPLKAFALLVFDKRR